VAIIAILAAIAVPNFLEAQVRSKISRIKADMRSLATAIESYRVDNNAYPILRGYIGNWYSYWHGGVHMCWDLTTPVAYVTSVDLADPFSGLGRDDTGWLDGARPYSFSYVNTNLARTEDWNLPKIDSPQWLLLSLGPDYQKGPNPTGQEGWMILSYANDPPSSPTPNDRRFALWEYDATNGTRSGGDIMRWQ
ncbi:MAG TPA: hypothetical protein VM492_07010, partial [Sumerlaeia bacterium]|nr:hypothetical protein [Sumerlaeia bacterium]